MPNREPYLIVNAAKAFQYLATILISAILVLVVVAAFMPAPVTGKLGLATGISLVVFSVFQLIAFSCMVAFVAECERMASVAVGIVLKPPFARALSIGLLCTYERGVSSSVVCRAPTCTQIGAAATDRLEQPGGLERLPQYDQVVRMDFA